MLSSLIPTDRQLFFSKNDPQDLRIGELVQTGTELPKNAFSLIGYPDDEGILLNGGRPGAQDAPTAVRKNLFKMTPHLHIEQTAPLHDLGDLASEFPLEQKHQIAQEIALKSLHNNNRLISIGGGHDYGYPDTAAFVEYCKAKRLRRPLIINFDAHLDVRPPDKGLSSGTPFYRLLENHKDFDFAEIGIQNQCNSKSHLQWSLKKGAKVLSLEEINLSGESFTVAVTQFLEDWLVRERPCFISVDIDAFSSAYAMGCSQSWPTGLEPAGFFQLLEVLLSRMNVLGLGVYEVSPPLDLDNRTSRLAAQIIHKFLF